MRTEFPYLLLADSVLALHVAVVAFVVGGLILVIGGNLRHWRWVNARWFRLAHLGAIVFVIAETWLGMVCPLTTLELWLRAQAGVAGYGGGFIEYWLQRVLYYEAPWWVFAIGYSLFGLIVIATWRYFPPVAGTRGHQPKSRGGTAQ